MSSNRPPRIHKFLAEWGVASRRRIEDWISQGRVVVNGRPAKPGDGIREGDELLVLDIDKTILYRATLRGVYDEQAKRWLSKEFEYWALNKPRGVLASTRDPHHKRMVTHLIKSSARLFPVGRLDKESEGLILLTSDGKLCHKLTHPRFGVRKRYHVSIDWPAEEEVLASIRKGGVVLEDGPTLPIEVKVLSPRTLELTLREGRKREIRRLLAHFSRKVLGLVRVAFGPIELGNLPAGQARELTPAEVSSLRKAVEPHQVKPHQVNPERGRPQQVRPHHRVVKRRSSTDTRRPGPGKPGHR